MIKTSAILFVLFYLATAHSQQTIDKLNSNQLKLPKETISKALSIDATGQVKSSATSDVELGYLSGVTSAIQDQINDKANDADAVHLTGDESISGVKTLTGKLVTSSTVNASIPCPVMTQTQRDAIASPVAGDCVFNSDTSLSNIYDGAIWKAMGGSGGGIGLWVTANGYAVDDVVIESNNIYICLTAHTSGTFATDLASLYWLRLSTDVTGATGLLPLATGGTNKSITASDGSIVYSDSDSLELLSPGTSGQILQTNGAAAPTFVNKSISGKAQNTTSVTIEEIQVPNNLLTATDTNKYLNETGNTNILSNPSFEHSTFSTSWTNVAGTFTQELTSVIDGKASAKLVLSAQAVSLTQSSTLYASQFADGVQGLAMVRIKSDIALRVCSIPAGTVSTTNCVTTATDSKWGLYKVPFILGATSNGISIASSGSVTGTVYIDDAFVGAISLESQNGACITSDCTTTFSFDASSAGVVSKESIDWISGNGSVAATSQYTYTFNASTFSVAPNCTCTAQSNGTAADRTCQLVSVSNSAITVYTTGNSGSAIYQHTVSCQKQGADFTQAEAKKTGNVFTTQCGANCVDVYSAVIASTTTDVVTSENVDFINGNCTTATVGRSTCTFNSGLVTQQLSCSCTTVINAANRSCAVLVQSSTSVLVSTTSGGVEADGIGFNLICQKQGADFVATRTIQGSFNEVNVSPGISKPIHFAYRTTAACTTGTCAGEVFGSTLVSTAAAFSSTGTYTIAVPSGKCSATPYCVGSLRPYVSTANRCSVTGTTATNINVACLNTSSVAVNEGFQVNCTCEAP